MVARTVLGLGLAVAMLAACNKPAEKKTEPAKPADATVKAPATPDRRPGLWNQTVSTGGMTQTFKICLDVATGKKLSAFGQQSSDTACTQTKLGRRPDGAWEFANTCDMGAGGHIETSGVATGDLATKYQVQATQVTTGASSPEANGTSQMTMTAEWTGPCPSDFAPGDLELPGGQRMNLSHMEPQAD